MPRLHHMLQQHDIFKGFVPLILLLMFCGLNQVSLALPIGGVLDVKPHVSAQASGQKNWASISERAKLTYGESIRTDATGHARVLFNNGTDVVLGGRSEIKIVAPQQADQPLVIRLLQGAEGILVHAQGATVIQSAACNAAVRGTKFLFQVSDTAQTTLTVLEGKVEFYNEHGRVLVEANEQSTARKGEAPTPPRAVSDVTGLISWTTDVTNLPFEYEQPATPNPQLTPALTLLARHDHAGARAALLQQPDSAQCNTLLGMLELRDGHPDAAVLALTKASADDALQYQAHALLALAYLTLNRLPDARTAAQHAVTLNPQSAQALATLALVQFYQGEPQANILAKRAIGINPYSPLALLISGRILMAQGQLDAARDELQQAKALAPELPVIDTELGQVYLRVGLVPKAEAAFRLALEKAVVSPDALTGLGICLQQQGKTAEARTAYQQALALDPHHTSAHVNLAALEMENGDLTRAAIELRSGEAEQSENGMLYAKLAQLSLYRQQVFEAQTYARRAVKLLPKSAIAHFQLGQVYQEQGRLMQARQEYLLAATLDPHYAPARYALGVVRGILEAGMDLSHPLGAIDAVTQGGPAQTMSLQNRQAPGLEDRLQAAIADPTVVRVASRAFGDTQVDGLLGEEHTTHASLSYLHEAPNRRSVVGVTGSLQQTDGVRANADRLDEEAGLDYGWRAPDHRIGVFALLQFDRSVFGADTTAISKPYNQFQRAAYETPYYLLGGTRQWTAQQQTSVVVTTERPYNDVTNSSSNQSLAQHFQLRHAEVRHDLQWADHVLSAGMGYGHGALVSDTFFPSPMPPLLPDMRSTLDQEVEWQEAYLHGTLHLSPSVALIGEVRADRVINTTTTAFTSPPLPTTVKHEDTTEVLPSMAVTCQLTARDGLRLRTQGATGSIDGYQLLLPTEVFLFPTSDLPHLKVGGRARSYALEYDHTFTNASTVWLGVIQEQAWNTQDADTEVLDQLTYQAVKARLESVLTPTTTGFASLSFVNSHGIVNFDGTQRSPEEELSDVPRFTGEVGLQYLNTRGWFFQPSYGYSGSRFQAHDPASPSAPRLRIGGFGIANVRVGRRWGLHTSCYVEVSNLFDRQYTVLSQTTEQFMPGRQLRVGISQRF